MSLPLPRGTAAIVVLALACTTAAAQSILSQHGEIVLAVGDAAPGIPGATINLTSNFDSPVIDQNGTIVFRARLLGGGATAIDDRAYFLGRANGDLQLAVRAGDPAPGLPGVFLRSDTSSASGPGSAVRISPFGEILYFASSLSDDANPGVTTANDTALLIGPVGGQVLLTREGDPVPFLAAAPTYGSQSFSLQNNAINAAGSVLFTTALAIGSGTPAVVAADDTVMVTGSPGSLSVVSREGDTLPGGEVVIPVSGGNTLSFINQINELGQVLHELRFSTTVGTATTANDRALAVWTAGVDTIIAREGQQAPGLPAGVLFATPALGWTVDTGGATFTKSGKTAIHASLDGGGTVVGVDDRAVYFGGIGGMNLVMQKGSLAPGLGGVTFGNIGNSSLTCNENEVAFVGFFPAGGMVTTANDSSLWRGSNPGNLTMIAREGDLVPTSVLPATLNGPWAYDQISTGPNNPLLNGRGDLIFQVSVIETGTATPLTKTVVLCSTPVLGLQLLLDAGDTFTTTLGTGAWTGLSSTAGYNSGDGGQLMFNNQGDFAYRPNLAGAPTAAILRGHVGSLIAKPSSFSAVAGGTQNFVIDVSPTYGVNLYLVLGTLSGARPGFPSPLGPQTIPLNFDAWTQLSLDLAGTVVYPGSFGVTDGLGKANASFVLPPGFPTLQGNTLHHAVVVLNFSLQSVFVSEPSALFLY